MTLSHRCIGIHGNATVLNVLQQVSAHHQDLREQGLLEALFPLKSVFLITTITLAIATVLEAPLDPLQVHLSILYLS